MREKISKDVFEYKKKLFRKKYQKSYEEGAIGEQELFEVLFEPNEELIDLYKFLTIVYAGAFPNYEQCASISNEDIFTYLELGTDAKTSFIKEISKKYNLTYKRAKKELEVFAQIEIFERFKKVQAKYENGEIDKKELYKLLFGENSKYSHTKLSNYLVYYYKECLESKTLPNIPKRVDSNNTKSKEKQTKHRNVVPKKLIKKPMDNKLYWYISLYEQRKNNYSTNCRFDVS